MLRKVGILFIVVLAITAAGTGYAYNTTSSAQAQATETVQVQTAVVRTGSIIISASGSGTVIAADEVQVGFENSGRLSEINVQVGDQVKKGDILAILVSTDSQTSLALKVTSAKLAVIKAQNALDELKNPEDNSLALAQKLAELEQARLDLLTAQDEVEDAYYTLNSLLNGRGNAQLISEAKAKLVLAESQYERAQVTYGNTPGDPGEDVQKAQALANLESAKRAYNLALASVNWYLGTPSEQELAEANAEILLAQANVATMQAKISDLEIQVEELKNNEPDTYEISLAETELENAQLQLTSAEEAMEPTTLVAPIDATVIEISANVGNVVGTSPIITLYDLSQPMLEVFVDETDLNQIGPDYEIEVVFDALPDQVFSGKIISVEPTLQNMNNVSVVKALALLDESSYAKPQTLPVGLNASVEVIGSKAENVLLVPVEAVRELSEGSYGVFVMENGQPELRVVTVGLMDYTYAEIKSGVELGDVVTTGIVETGQ
jgi:multidrug efflux pump subunit AcrA (membrane-fusion protein)